MLLSVDLGASGIWNWLPCLCLWVTNSKPRPREMCQSCWWLLNNSTERAAGLGLVPRRPISRPFCWQCELRSKAQGPPGRQGSRCQENLPSATKQISKAGLPGQGISPEIILVIKISFFPAWDITIPIYLPPPTSDSIVFSGWFSSESSSWGPVQPILKLNCRNPAFPPLPITTSKHFLRLFCGNPTGLGSLCVHPSTA